MLSRRSLFIGPRSASCAQPISFPSPRTQQLGKPAYFRIAAAHLASLFFFLFFFLSLPLPTESRLSSPPTTRVHHEHCSYRTQTEIESIDSCATVPAHLHIYTPHVRLVRFFAKIADSRALELVAGSHRSSPPQEVFAGRVRRGCRCAALPFFAGGFSMIDSTALTLYLAQGSTEPSARTSIRRSQPPPELQPPSAVNPVLHRRLSGLL